MTKDLREEAMFQVQMLGEEIQPDWIVAAFEFFEAKLKEKNS